MNNNDCGHQCYIVGGPFIAEDPDCPIHKRKLARIVRPVPCSRCYDPVYDWRKHEYLIKDTPLEYSGETWIGDAIILCEKCETVLTDWWKEFWNV